MKNADRSRHSWKNSAAITLAFTLVAWSAYVALKGDDLRRSYNVGNNMLKWYVATFMESFTVLLLIPFLPTFALSLMISALMRHNDILRSYNHGLITSGIWMVLALIGFSLAQG